MSLLSKEAPINIVGAGIFGLSTALHLARRGYKNVTVFDKQPYDDSLYSYLSGCDAASADLNKIIRSAYGSQIEYQELSIEAIDAWKSWNAELQTGVDIPPALNRHDKIFYNCGNLSMSVGDMLPQFELDTIQAMEACGHKDTQLITTNAQHVAIADGRGQGYAMDPFYLHKRGKNNIGVLDSTGGLVAADKACLFALHKARGYGAKFILDPVAGAFTSLATSAEGKTIGIKTADGNTHEAAVTIMACGGWTPSLLPRLDYLCEATAGSVVMYKIPRSSKLWDRFDPERFPSWLWKVRDGANGGVYGFPRDDQGYLKIGYRGIKYTNPQIQSDGKERSTPVTRWTKDQQLTQIPDQAMNVINGFVDEYIPELREEGIDIELTRVCWYTDTFDNHFVIDYDPDDEGLFVATGGSGHAFKYLPNIGDHVVDILERKAKHRMTTHAWRWRARGDKPPLNVLMQGSKDARALENVKLARVDGVRAKL